MYLMRIGAAGSEKPVARIDDHTYADPCFTVRHLSRFTMLESGDLINAGTPPGAGLGHGPPIRLRPGDVLDLGVSGLGSRRQRVLGPR